MNEQIHDSQNQEVKNSTPNNSPKQTIRIKHAHKFIFGYIFLIIFAAVVAGTYSWQHDKVKNLESQVSSLEKAAAKPIPQKTKLVAVTSSVPVTETDTLPNGTKVSYPLTVANANVVWWSDGNNSPAADNMPLDGDMILSDKHVIQFLSTLPTDVIQSVCTDNWNNEIGYQMGIYDTTNATLTLHNQYENCIETIANGANSKYAAPAKLALTTATNDIDAWSKSLTVIK